MSVPSIRSAPAASARERPIVVAFDARLVRNQMTGIGRYALELLRGFARARLPLEIEVLTPTDLAPDHPLGTLPGLSEPPTRIRLVPVNVPCASVRQHLRMGAVLKGIEHDLYHYPHFDLPTGGPSPAVITIHDLKYVRYPGLLRSWTRSRYLSWMMRRGARGAAAIIAVSEATRADVGDLMGVPIERVHTVHEAGGMLPPPDRDALRRLGLAPGYLLCVGERRPHKNLARLIAAYAEVRRRIPAAPPLVIVGHPWAGDRSAEAEVARRGLARRVRLLDRVSDPELAALYGGARVFVLPSLYEGFGLPLLEAMEAALPIVTSNVSSMPEIVGDAALLVDPGKVDSIASAITRLLVDELLARRLVRRGADRARAFSWERAATETLAVYERVLGRGAESPAEQALGAAAA